MTAVKLPTGDSETEIPVASGSTDYTLGLTAGRESRRFYYFVDLRYRLNGENDKNLKQGDVVMYGASFGVRPWLGEYWEPDLVLLWELFGKQQSHANLNSQKVKNTGGQSLFSGPSFLWSYKNWMVTGGFALPVSQDT